MRVKICGLTHPDDALAAVDAGADAIGLNFVGGPRRIEPSAGRAILKVLPPQVTPVALVRLNNGTLAAELAALFNETRVVRLQLYGQVDDAALAGLSAAGYSAMPVVAVKDDGFGDRLLQWGGLPPGCRPVAVVLDAYDPAREGGTGRSFQWEWVAHARPADPGAWPPILLAGGLTPGNVGEAIRIAQPFGVDVSSGVELDGSPGRKDYGKLVAFVRNARQAMGLHTG